MQRSPRCEDCAGHASVGSQTIVIFALLNVSDYSLVQVAHGAWTVRSELDGETFHPVIGPEAEANALYIGPMRLLERFTRLAPTETMVLWDVGLGAAANATTVLRTLSSIHGSLHLVSFDKTLAPLEFALQHAADLGFPLGYEQALTSLLHQHHATFTTGVCRVRWDVHVGDFPTWVRSAPTLAAARANGTPPPHAVLYDAYSPRRNAEMWTLPHFASLRNLLRSDMPCTLATYSRSTRLRVTLLLAGFYVGTGAATGEKEETTMAATKIELLERPLDAVWLNRVRRSTAAQPIVDAQALPGPLEDAYWRQLCQHPQFSHIPLIH